MLPLVNAATPAAVATLQLQERYLPGEQLERFEGYMAEIFSAFGMDVTGPATRETPRRFLDALREATAGYDGDPKLMTAFETECDHDPTCQLSQIVEGPIEFYALCEHHALPFFGHAYVGYVAGERILGISKLTRLVRLFARRFSVQERLGQQIADALVELLEPHGVAVYVQAHHLCVQMRGVCESSPQTHTTVWRGAYQADADLRADFFVTSGLRR
jgi:GTP cyclohydrolase IA